MKLQTEIKDVVKSQEFQTVNYGVSTENLPLLFQMLRTNLYSDIHGSIIREVVSNVIDSHTEANKKDAIGEVEWVDENRLLGIDNQLIIRDFGIGLSPERMRNIYGNYLSSTKRDSNDTIGGFGLGSKVPFAYTDSFFVNTTSDGVQYKYLCYIDSTQLGAISLLESKPTSKENGTEIVIPVKSRLDKPKFQSSIIKQLSYFRNIRYIGFEAPRNKVLFEDEHCIILENSPYPNLHLVLGNVAYPIDPLVAGIDIWTSGTSGCSIGLKFKIGDLQPTLSRESIFWNENVKKKVHEKMELARKSIRTEIEKELKNEKDYAKWYSSVINQRSKTFPHQWIFSKVKTDSNFYPGDGSKPLRVTSLVNDWFAGMNIRTVVPFRGYSRRSKIASKQNPEYSVYGSSLNEILTMPIYKIENSLSSRKSLWLFKQQPEGQKGFVVVSESGIDHLTPAQKSTLEPYFTQASKWRLTLKDYDDIVVPDTEFASISDDKYKEAYKKLVAQRKLEGKFTAKILKPIETYLSKISNSFDYSKYEGKFEDHKDLLIIYGTQEESEYLKKVAAMLSYCTTYFDGVNRIKNIAFLKIGQQYLKQFSKMPKAYHVNDVLKMKTPMNSILGNIVTASKINKLLPDYKILSDFESINRKMKYKYLKVSGFVQDNSAYRRWQEPGLLEEITQLCEDNDVKNTEIENIFKEITKYFEGAELLKYVEYKPTAVSSIRDYLSLKNKTVDPENSQEIPEPSVAK